MNQFGQAGCAAAGGGNAQVRCSTPGATLYVTLNGSLPSPSNYIVTGSSPLGAVVFGETIRARAFKVGLRTSATQTL